MNIIWPTRSARTGDTRHRQCCMECSDAPTRKKCSLACCMPPSLPAISTGMGMSGSRNGASLGKMASQVRRSPSGCTKERSRLNIRPQRSQNIPSASRPITSRSNRYVTRFLTCFSNLTCVENLQTRVGSVLLQGYTLSRQNHRALHSRGTMIAWM